MADAFSEMIESLNHTTQGLKNETDINEIISIIRAELYSYFGRMNSLIAKLIEENKNVTSVQMNEWKKIIEDNNKKSELLRSDIQAYLQNNNMLFKEMTKHLKEISRKVSKPTLIPPPLEIPNEMLKKLDKMIELQEKTHGELEGLDFKMGIKEIGQTNVAERLAHKFKSKSILIIANKNNDSIVYCGNEGVRPSTGTPLNPGESIQLDTSQSVREIWIYGTRGDSVNFVALCYKPEMMKGGSR